MKHIYLQEKYIMTQQNASLYQVKIKLFASCKQKSNDKVGIINVEARIQVQVPSILNKTGILNFILWKARA